MKKLFTLLALVFYGFVSGQNLNLKLQELNTLSSEFGFSVSNDQLKIIALIDSESQNKGNFYLLPLKQEFETSMTYVSEYLPALNGDWETFIYKIRCFESFREGGCIYFYNNYYGHVTKGNIESIEFELGPNFNKAKRIYLILNEILR